MKPTDRRTVLKTLATGTLLATTAGSAAARLPGRADQSAEAQQRGPANRQGANADKTITEIAANNDDFETLVSLLQDTGLDDVLDQDGAQYTVFAPTDAAFDALFEDVDPDSLTTDEVENILLYHVTDGRRYAKSVVNAYCIDTLNGEKIYVDGTTLNDGKADIVSTDIEASNGIIHVLDGVLLP